MQPTNLVLLSNQVALMRSMDVIANNVANSNTTGFKREGIEFDTLLANVGINKKPLALVVDRATYRDTSNGPIKMTGNALDLAIQGSGYFEVRMENGSIGYTRDGSFQLNSEGQIVTHGGLPVLDQSGQGITLPSTTSQINISGDGFVSARVDNSSDLAQLGKIAIVGVPNEQDMQSAGEGLYTTAQAATPAASSSVVQGSLEQSNVEPVTEMTTMIKVTRAYEMIANIISDANQRESAANDKLSKSTG